MDGSDVFAVGLVCAMVLLIFVSIAFLLSGLDDLFIDLCYFFRATYRRLLVDRLWWSSAFCVAVMSPVNSETMRA